VRIAEVAAQAGDVHDLDGLRAIGVELANTSAHGRADIA
jgi:hypothetical protein